MAQPGLPPLTFVGDSHLAYFRVAAERGMFGVRLVNLYAVAGATAVGLRNPQSLTNALPQFREALSRTDRSSVVVMHLGEVDCGFVIWYRAEKYADSVEDQLRASLAAYFAFVDETVAAGFGRLVVTGATLPTIRDGSEAGEVAKLRREVKASLSERTQLTLAYNAELRRGAEERSLPYVDITEDLLDPATGVLRPHFRNPDSTNHHLDYDLAGACWGRRLQPLVM